MVRGKRLQGFIEKRGQLNLDRRHRCFTQSRECDVVRGMTFCVSDRRSGRGFDAGEIGLEVDHRAEKHHVQGLLSGSGESIVILKSVCENDRSPSRSAEDLADGVLDARPRRLRACGLGSRADGSSAGVGGAIDFAAEKSQQVGPSTRAQTGISAIEQSLHGFDHSGDVGPDSPRARYLPQLREQIDERQQFEDSVDAIDEAGAFGIYGHDLSRRGKVE